MKTRACWKASADLAGTEADAAEADVALEADGPWLHPALELEKIRLLGLPGRDQALIMGGNFLRLIGQG
ncbi:MAG: hypothetical protein H7Z39_00100 [Burkholderiaceae bacterium]|nr:hypothetical protein [Burkholderiaceae bacterium]